MIKLIVVNKPKNFKRRRLEAYFKNVRSVFLKQKIRNKNFLSLKKELTVVFLSALQMQNINNQFRKKNKPTDVLSFESAEVDSIGELLFCVDVLKIQAAEQKHSFEDEFNYMLIHGLLHLLGYDHETSKNEEKLMFRLQDQCFAKLNTI